MRKTPFTAKRLLALAYDLGQLQSTLDLAEHETEITVFAGAAQLCTKMAIAASQASKTPEFDLIRRAKEALK